MDENDIEILETDLFKFNKELVNVWFRNNKIRSTSIATFDHLTKLAELDLVDNFCMSQYIEAQASISIFLIEVKGSCVHDEITNVQKDIKSQLEMIKNLTIKTIDLLIQIKITARLVISLNCHKHQKTKDMINPKTTKTFRI